MVATELCIRTRPHPTRFEREQGREAHAPSQRAPEDGEALVRQLINGQVAEPWLRHGCETTGALCTNYVR